MSYKHIVSPEGEFVCACSCVPRKYGDVCGFECGIASVLFAAHIQRYEQIQLTYVTPKNGHQQRNYLCNIDGGSCSRDNFNLKALKPTGILKTLYNELHGFVGEGIDVH
jgi:hypothetical protein